MSNLPDISPSEVVANVAAMFGVVLNPMQLELAVSIYSKLPDVATFQDFAVESDPTLAATYGISTEQLEGIQPLVEAMKESLKPNRYRHLFDSAD